MKQLELPFGPEDLVKRRFSEAGIEAKSIEKIVYPEETIFIVKVPESDFDEAVDIGNSLDNELVAQDFDGFVTVRKAEKAVAKITGRLKRGVKDSKATDFVNLLIARSRASEIQPSLSYIPDTAKNIYSVITPRHQLIFGRRGAGKTTIMVEAKRLIDNESNVSVWINIQTHRHQDAHITFVWICERICSLIQTYYMDVARTPNIVILASKLNDDLQSYISANIVDPPDIKRLVPRMQSIVHRFLETNAIRLFIFLDDLHYLPKSEQPKLLDLLHSSVRECDAWLKIAGIKHLSSWYQSNPPLGLQTGQDADHIDLDITLENPQQAKNFLEQVLSSYAKFVGISSLSRSVISTKASARLVLAAGAVPRDYLALTAESIRQAQARENAKLVGVQDVNNAAGIAAKVKIAELEDDAASNEGVSQSLISGLNCIRNFCINEKSTTYFRVDFRDKEQNPEEYSIVQELMDLRLVHLINASLPDERKAGHRSEVYMLDLSQFSGQRLKRKIKALDFVSGHIVLKETATRKPDKIGDTPKKRLAIFRRGPLFHLKALSA